MLRDVSGWRAMVSASVVLILLGAMSVCAQEQAEDQVLEKFIAETLVTLRNYTKEELKLDAIITELKERSDMVTFAYTMALLKTGAPPNTWNNSVKQETGFWIYFLCPIAKYVGLPPKETKRQEEMQKIRRTLYEGYFERTIAGLSRRKLFQEMSYATVQKIGSLPPIEQLVNPKWLTKEQIEKARGVLQ